MAFNKDDYNAENIPKTKEEWTQLRDADVNKWADLTQANTDRMFRENKESKEKIVTLTNTNQNLQVEIGTYKSKPKEDFKNLAGDTPPPPPDEGDDKKWNKENLPKDKDDWDNFFIDSPTEAADLRQWYLNNEQAIKDTNVQTHTECRKEVQRDHPEMYLPELDDAGQPKKDEKGKLVLKRDATTGEPLFNPKSEKGKLWETIWNEDPTTYGNSRNGPRLLMAEMERRLRQKGQTMIDNANVGGKENQVTPPGVPPPKRKEVGFKDDNEKAHAEKAVARGTYTSLEDYCEKRDAPNEGIYDENSTPSFS